jgi:fructose-specific phosphotransferase system IIA component
MRLTRILQPDAIKLPLESDQKQQAIYELTDLLCEQAHIQAVDELKQAIWQRELTRTTGIGHGIAIPHGKTNGCDSLVMAIGKAGKPIDFSAIDGQPVELIFLLASPADQTGPHIQALAAISRMLTDVALRNQLKHAQSPAELYQIIADHETAQVST